MVIVAFCYNIGLFKNPQIRFGELLVVKIVCERTSYHYGGLGAKPPAAGQLLQIKKK